VKPRALRVGRYTRPRHQKRTLALPLLLGSWRRKLTGSPSDFSRAQKHEGPWQMHQSPTRSAVRRAAHRSFGERQPDAVADPVSASTQPAEVKSATGQHVVFGRSFACPQGFDGCPTRYPRQPKSVRRPHPGYLPLMNSTNLASSASRFSPTTRPRARLWVKVAGGRTRRSSAVGCVISTGARHFVPGAAHLWSLSAQRPSPSRRRSRQTRPSS
jgi:hypothetical protein